MKKIIHFVGTGSTKYGGMERFFVKLVENNPDYQFFFVYEDIPLSENYLNELKKYNASILLAPCGSSVFNIMKLLAVYIRYVVSIKPDVIHFHFGVGLVILFTALCARCCGTKKVYRTNHLCMTRYGHPVEERRQLPWKYNFLNLYGYYKYILTQNIFVSKYVMVQHERIYGNTKRDAVIYMGVENKKVTQNNKEIQKQSLRIGNEFVICTILFAIPLKGCDVLIDALEYLNRKDYVLLIVGMDPDSPYTKEQMARAYQLGVEDRIRWIGITDNVRQYLEISDIFVQPSRSDALPLAACEALSESCIVVGSAVGGLPEVANYTFPSENSYKLAMRINDIMNLSADSLMIMKEKARQKYLTHFSLVSGIMKYTELYDIRK